MQAYSFRRMTLEDLAMIHRWLETPAVREWWIDADDLAEPDVAMWVVSFNDRPFAFMQDYDPHASEGHHFAQSAASLTRD